MVMAKDAVDFKDLNREQLQAVKYKKGPLLIIAGAGTGKTTVVTERIKYLITKGYAKPSEILALTFTDKAAREMEERVDVAMPYGHTQMWISTFHSFCDRILRNEALHIGLNPRYKLMNQAEAVQLIRNNLFKFDLKYFRPLGNPTKFVGGMIQHFSRLQDEDIEPNDYLAWTKKLKSKKTKRLPDEEKIEIEKWKELSKVFKTYDELKVKEGVMDFGDLIVKTLALFRKRPNILVNYQRQFKYVLVDEYQDTNYAQNELAIMLSKKHKNITATGDDDQSVYRFRGAAVSNIIQFKKTYKNAKIIVLTQNYRSSQEILDKAYALIQHNNPDRLEAVEKVDKKLVAQRKAVDSEIKFIHKDRVENEANEVARVIRRLIDEKNFNYRDFAILIRANNHSEPFIRALSRHAIPYQFLGPGRLFKQPEIIDLISYLNVLCNFEDSVSLYRLLTLTYFGISPRDLVKIGNYARRVNLTLFEACEKIDDVFVAPSTREKVKKILKVIDKHIGLSKKETAGQLLYYFLEDTGLLQKLLNPDSAQAEKRTANISKFFDKLKTYEVNHEDATVTAVVDWIELSSELGESPLAIDTDWTEVNAVNILTAHSAKGLEFPVVFLVNLVGQRFPTVHRREQIPIPDELIKEILPKGDYHEQEERRLFYVGMTRAMDRLYFTAANYYGEGKREKRLSPFIFESLGDDAVASEQPDDSQQLSFLDYEPKAKPSEVLTKGDPPLHIDFLSYSQIETFRICPLHYKLKYILKIPTPPSAALSFGSSVHAALRDFYIQVKTGGKPTLKIILEILDENWIKEGYKNKSHEEGMRERGKVLLAEFLKKGFEPKKIPEAVEQMFVVPLRVRGRSGPAALHHTPSTKHLRPLKIGGRIDRVDKARGGKIEIIDYKTGARIPTQKEVDQDLQLTFYALAATKISEEPFGKKSKNLILSLYYLDKQMKITTTRTSAQLKAAIKEIFEWRDKIEKSDFACSKHKFCENCEYSLLCRADS